MTNRELFKNYIDLFLEENHKVNLISKNDEKYLWEKHICDSLALEKFFEKYSTPKNILDIGTGGGFPSVPLAIVHSDIEITALDSITKKIRAVTVFKEKLGLDNLIPVCSRVENYNKKFEMVTSRAVASLDKISTYALEKLNKNGYFAAFKSRKIDEEIKEAEKILKRYNSKIVDIIDYKLPVKEDLERYLIVIKKL